MLKIPLLETGSLVSKTPKKRLSRLDSYDTGSNNSTPKDKDSPKASPKNRRGASVRNIFNIQPIEVPAEKIMSYREKLDRILAAPHRTREEARIIYEDLEDTPFCTKYLDPSDFDDVAILDVFKNMKLEKYPKGTVFIREGDESNNKAYILMKGVVGIYRKKQDFYTMQNQQAEEKEERVGPNSGRLTPSRDLKNSSFKLDSIQLKTSLNNVINDSMSKFRKESELIPSNNASDKEPLSRRLSQQSLDDSIIGPSGTSTPNSNEVLTLPAQKEGQVFKKSLFGEMLLSSLVKNNGKSIFKNGESPKNNQNYTFTELREGDETVKSNWSRGSLNFDFMKKKKIDKPIPEDPYAYLGFHLHDITEKGEIFGELALQLSSNRTASIVAKKDVVLLSITKDIYTNMRRKRAIEEAEQRNFLFNLIPFLDQVHNEESKREIIRNFNLTIYPRKSLPIAEGDLGEDIIIIYEGVVLVTKTFYVEVDNDYIDKSDKYYQHFRNKKVEKEEINLGYFGKGTIFGEEILTVKKNECIPYRYTLQVTSDQAKIFRVSRTALRSKIPMETTKELKASFLIKKDNLDEELVAEAEKRKLYLTSPNLDSYPVFVKRQSVKLKLPKQGKINMKFNKIDTLKVLSNRANPSFLPKVLGAPAFEAKDHDPKNVEFLRSFSRYNFMPKSPDRNFEIVENNNLGMTNARHILRPSFGGQHISSNEGKSPKNLDVCLNVIEEKFEIKLNSKAERHRFLSNVKNFKFSFDGESQMLRDAPDKSKRFMGLGSPRTTKITTTTTLNTKTLQSFTNTNINFSKASSPFHLQSLSLKDVTLYSPKDPTISSPKDAILISPTETLIPSPKDQVLYSPKDPGLLSPKEVTLHSPKESTTFSTQQPTLPSIREPVIISSKENLDTKSGFHSPKESIGAYIDASAVMTNNSEYHINHNVLFSPDLPSFHKILQRGSVKSMADKKINKSAPKISMGVNKFSDKTKLKGVIQKAKENLVEYKLKMLEQQINEPTKKEAYLYKCFL